MSEDKIQGWRADYISVDEEASPSPFQRIVNDFAEAARSGMYKEPSDLTEKERIALAWIAGCQMEFSWRDGKMVFTTLNPVGFAKPYPDQPIRVYERRD